MIAGETSRRGVQSTDSTLVIVTSGLQALPCITTRQVSCKACLSPLPIIERGIADALRNALRAIIQLERPVSAVQDLHIGGLASGGATDVVLQRCLLGGKGSQGDVRSALVAVVHCRVLPVPGPYSGLHLGSLCAQTLLSMWGEPSTVNRTRQRSVRIRELSNSGLPLRLSCS